MSSWTTITIASTTEPLDDIRTALETHATDGEIFTTERDNVYIDTVSLRVDGLHSDEALGILAAISAEHNLHCGVINLCEDTNENVYTRVWAQPDGALEQQFEHTFTAHPRGGIADIAVVLQETYQINAPHEP